jgi:hypothetical protein
MKRTLLVLLLTFGCGLSSFAQEIIGLGVELSPLSLKPNYRNWMSRTTGFEVFGGIASELEEFSPNDVEAGLKVFHTLIYWRTNRIYIGAVGKWKWININTPERSANLPVTGILVGSEWYLRRIYRKGFAVELGYQFGKKDYEIFSKATGETLGKTTFEEFPLILNLRYSFYKKKKKYFFY